MVESTQENDLWVDGAFMTEKMMIDENFDLSFGYRNFDCYMHGSTEYSLLEQNVCMASF